MCLCLMYARDSNVWEDLAAVVKLKDPPIIPKRGEQERRTWEQNVWLKKKMKHESYLMHYS